jgi:hypothetical protein
MNYEIIKNQKVLEEFIDWLPDIETGETYFIALFARRKYCKDILDIGADKQQLKRLTCNKKELIIPKLRQLEIAMGNYTKKELEIPQAALAVYISPNPRDMVLAAKNATKVLLDLVLKPYTGYNPHQEVLSEIQKACSRRIWLDFDFDTPYITEIDDQICEAFMEENCWEILMTKNGFHLLVNTTKVPILVKKTWYQKITKIKGIDIRGDNLIPIPGCTQGNFIPYFL